MQTEQQLITITTSALLTGAQAAAQRQLKALCNQPDRRSRPLPVLRSQNPEAQSHPSHGPARLPPLIRLGKRLMNVSQEAWTAAEKAL